MFLFLFVLLSFLSFVVVVCLVGFCLFDFFFKFLLTVIVRPSCAACRPYGGITSAVTITSLLMKGNNMLVPFLVITKENNTNSQP